MRRRIIVSAAIALVLIASAVIGGAQFLAASANFKFERESSIFDFAASEYLISFPVVLAADTAALIVINRNSGERKIILDDSAVLHSPYLSSDGERLMFVKHKVSGNEQQLITCTTIDWHCRVVLAVEATIFSPVELTPQKILYSSSQLTKTGDRIRSDHHDLFLIKNGATPVRLTEFGAYRLSPISVGGHRVLVSAFHGKGLSGYGGEDELPVSKERYAPVSEIFSLDLDDSGDKIAKPEPTLTPHFLIPGYSTNAAISADGQTVAFINRRNTRGATHFNLAIADWSEKVLRYVVAKGYGFSTPVFVGRTIVANELLADRYQVKQFTADAEPPKIISQLGFSVEGLKQIPRVSLSFD
jgi:WD40-like Beta Propeller Repeat